MTCDFIRTKDGGVLIVCDRRTKMRKRCRFCGEWGAGKLCDYPLRGKKEGKTCDAPMCVRCAVVQPNAKHTDGDTVDFCPPHARQAEKPEQLSL